MAARGLGRGAAHGVILPPSGDFDGWLAALTEAAAAGGWSLIPFDGGEAPKLESRTIPLLFDAAQAASLPGLSWTVVAPGLDGAVRATAARYGLPLEQGLWVASRLLAAACALPDARWIVEVDPGAGPVEILPGLSVTPPARAPAHDPDVVAEAMKLFDAGPPGVGAATNWRPELFSYDTRRPPLGPDARELDLTGAPQTMFGGPYVSLPPGRWRATIGFGIDAAAARRRFRLEWGDQAAFATHRFRPDQAGLYALEIDHRWDAAAPAEMRLVLEEGAIDGALTFDGLRLERVE